MTAGPGLSLQSPAIGEWGGSMGVALSLHPCPYASYVAPSLGSCPELLCSPCGWPRSLCCPRYHTVASEPRSLQLLQVHGSTLKISVAKGGPEWGEFGEG